MNTKLRFLAAAVATAAIAVVPTWAPARADESVRYHYFAGEGGGALLDPRDTPVGTFAPAGYETFVAKESSISFHVDDHVALDGLAVPVWVTQGGRTLFSGCMPVRAVVTVGGARPGQGGFVRVGEFLEELHCSTKATIGVVTISGVRAR